MRNDSAARLQIQGGTKVRSRHPYESKNIRGFSEHPVSTMCLNAQRMQGKRAFDEISSVSDVQPPTSKRRRSGPSPRYPPEFWDTLSKVPLTRGALRELDRRTSEHDCTPSGRTKRTITSRRLLRSDSRRLKGLAAKGGLDLSVLRGVRCSRVLLEDGNDR